MSGTPRDDLAEAIARRQVVIVVGAGVAVDATGAEPVAGWVGLLDDAVSRCEEYAGLSSDDAAQLHDMIHSGQVLKMMLAAEWVTTLLGGADAEGQYARWLRASIGKLRCRKRDLIEALVALRAPIATTNYDNLLEEVTGLPAVTWKHSGRIQRVLQEDEDEAGIIHLHGHFREPESVILGIRSYEQLKQADAPQAIERALTVLKKLVFVGCGDGLEDPNFEALRAFLSTFPDSQHFRLCRAGEEYETLRRLHANEPIEVLSYGEGYGHLLPFIQGLRTPGDDAATGVGTPAAPAAEPRVIGTPFDVPSLRPDYLDRPEDLDRIRELLRESEVVGITGAAGPGGVPRRGVGKKVLAAQFARDQRVLEDFVDGVYWVELGSGKVDEARRDLAGRLGIEVAENDPAADDRLKDDLRTALADRRCLLVLADVPDGGAFEALQVAGTNGRTLCTSAYRSVLDGHPAAFVEIDVPEDAAAVRLLEKAAGLKEGGSEAVWEPGDVERILAATGRMPHALALAGATIGKDGRTPAAVADDLENGRYLGYAESGAAMWSVLGALPPDDARRYRQLAVFPEDEPIPLAALERLWRQDPDALVETLGQRNLVTIQAPASDAAEAPAGAAIRVKRALLLMLADDLRETHRRLIEAYADRCSVRGDWATLPHDEPYIWDHLVHHLHGMRAPEALQAVARDVGFLAVHAHLSGPHAVQRDLATAAGFLPDDETIEWLNRFLETSGHLLAGHPDLPALAASLRLMLLDAPEGVDPCRLDSPPPGAPALPGGPLSLLPPLYLKPLWRRPQLLGALVREACLYKTAINALAFSADGRLAAGGSRGILRIWDSELLGQPTQIDTGAGAIRALAFAPAGRMVATGGSDGSVRIWDVETRQDRHLADHGEESVRAVAFSPDGRQVASCADDGSVRISSVGDGPVPKAPAGDGESFRAVAYSPKGGILALGGDHGRVRIWDLASERETEVRTVGAKAVTSVAFSPDGNLLAFGEQYGGVGIWDLARGREPVILEGPETSVTAVAFSETGEPLRLASGGDDGSVRLWQPDAGGRMTTVVHNASSRIRAVAFSPAGDRLVSGDVDGRVRVWDVAEAETGQSLDEEMSSISAIAMSPDGRLLATGGDDGRVRIREAATDGRDALPPLGGGGGAKISALAFSADSEHLAWSGGEGTVHLWSRQNGPGAASLRSPRSVKAVAVSGDGRRVAAACADGFVRVWDTESGPEPRELLPKRKRPALAVAFSPDGRRVLSGGKGGPIMSWDVGEGDDGVALVDPGGQVNVIACAPVDTLIAFGCGDGRVGLLDAGDGGPQYLEGHADEVNALAFSSDGSLLASAATDGSAHMLDLSRRKMLLQADAGVLGLGLAWTGGRRDDWTGSRVALLLDGAVLLAEMVDRRSEMPDRR